MQDAGCRTREGGPQPSTALSDISYLALSGFYFCLFPVTEEVQGSAVQFSGVRSTCWHMSHQNVHQWVWPVLSRGAELMSLVKSLMWDNMMGRCWLPQGLPFNQEIREIIFDSALRQWWQWQWSRRGVWDGDIFHIWVLIWWISGAVLQTRPWISIMQTSQPEFQYVRKCCFLGSRMSMECAMEHYVFPYLNHLHLTWDSHIIRYSFRTTNTRPRQH